MTLERISQIHPRSEGRDGDRPGFQEKSKTQHRPKAYAVGKASRRQRPDGGGDPEHHPELRADLDALAHAARHEVDEEDHVRQPADRVEGVHDIERAQRRQAGRSDVCARAPAPARRMAIHSIQRP